AGADGKVVPPVAVDVAQVRESGSEPELADGILHGEQQFSGGQTENLYFGCSPSLVGRCGPIKTRPTDCESGHGIGTGASKSNYRLGPAIKLRLVTRSEVGRKDRLQNFSGRAAEDKDAICPR